jgi:glyceraldehyde-3-phosphate dehydrogenase (NADP+)
MRAYNEEQFGPVVPIATFKDLSDIYEYLAQSPYGQQASVFSSDSQKIAELIDVLVNQVLRK